jgi:hypothetical protein
VFNLYGNDRLTEWKRIRNQLEVRDNPFLIVADLWSRAPLVNLYLDPKNPAEWPDPWHLVLDDRFDDLAIPLGMLYTIKLTERFMDTVCEIHMSMSQKETNPRFFLVVDNKHVLNYEPRVVLDPETLTYNSNKIWSVTQFQ